MSTMRQDPTTGEWVILATERAKRPHDLARAKTKPEPPAFLPSCPFCPGNEGKTPKETLVYGNDRKGGWKVRAFANRFPALRADGDTSRRREHEFFLEMDGVGIHEVIVESPEHNRPLALMEESGVRNVLLAYQERYHALSQMPFVKLVIIFENHGSSAGTSLEHPHSQVIATPVVPRHVRLRHEIAVRYYDNVGRCLYSDLTAQELSVGKRVVMETKGFVVFHPFASHEPFETWIVPKKHQACFGEVLGKNIDDLAHVLRINLLKLYRGLNNPDYNFIIDTAPSGESADYYLWHLRIIPRLTEVAGFEIGSGININTALPEETAQFIRELPVE
jgi:UDPglucose--hexose-1-phosphate uridylyltransferase